MPFFLADARRAPAPPRRVRALTALAGAVAALALLAVPAGAAAPPTLTPFAGNGTTGAVVPGPALSTRVSGTAGIGTDADGNVYVTESPGNRIDKITPDGTVSFFAGNGTNGTPVAGPALSSPLGNLISIAVDGAGNVIAIDGDHRRILRITPAGVLSIIAGNGASGSPVAGAALASPLNPGYSLAADAAGNVYFQDDAPETVWKVTPGGALVKVAGSGATGLAVPGPALASPMDQFYGTFAVGADGTVYAADTAHCVVVAISSTGTLSFAAGTGSCGTTVPGPATATPLGHVQGVALDATGNLYLAVRDDHLVLRVTPGGTLSIYAGNGALGTPVAGPPTASPLDFILFITADPAGTVYVTDSTRIQRIGPATPSAPRDLAVTPGDGTTALSFRPPVTPGTSTITGYEVSTDGGATWQALTTSPGSGTARLGSVPGLPAGTSTSVRVRAVNASGGGEFVTAVATLPAPPVVITAPAAPAPTVAPTLKPPSRFKVAVRLRLPKGCGKGCVITGATLRLRDGRALLGRRSGIAVEQDGWVRFTIDIDRAVLVAASGKLAKPGWRTTLTRFTVATRTPSGTTWKAVKLGHITVSDARLASGLDPRMAGLL